MCRLIWEFDIIRREISDYIVKCIEFYKTNNITMLLWLTIMFLNRFLQIVFALHIFRSSTIHYISLCKYEIIASSVFLHSLYLNVHKMMKTTQKQRKCLTIVIQFKFGAGFINSKIVKVLTIRLSLLFASKSKINLHILMLHHLR